MLIATAFPFTAHFARRSTGGSLAGGCARRQRMLRITIRHCSLSANTCGRERCSRKCIATAWCCSSPCAAAAVSLRASAGRCCRRNSCSSVCTATGTMTCYGRCWTPELEEVMSRGGRSHLEEVNAATLELKCSAIMQKIDECKASRSRNSTAPHFNNFNTLEKQIM